MQVVTKFVFGVFFLVRYFSKPFFNEILNVFKKKMTRFAKKKKKFHRTIYLKGLSSEMDLANSGINKQISL
jgi:hypothetical protein